MKMTYFVLFKTAKKGDTLEMGALRYHAVGKNRSGAMRVNEYGTTRTLGDGGVKVSSTFVPRKETCPRLK